MNFNNTALLLVGFQNDYFASDGILYSFIEESSSIIRVVDNTVQLLKYLISTPMLVIATPIIFTPNYEELTDPVGILKTIRDVNAFQAGTEGSEMINELLPLRSRILEISGKRGFNAFMKTQLDQVLKQRQIKHLVLAGAVTSICIDSTGRFAHELGYSVSILSDCTSARSIFEQEFYFTNIFPLYAETISRHELIQKIKS